MMRGLALAALALGSGAVAGGGEPSAWGRVPVFAEADASGCERVLQRQLERYGGDLAASVNKLRDMANAARSPAVQAALLRQVDSVVEHWQANLATLEETLLVPFPRALAIAPGRSAANATEPEAYTQTGYDDIYQALRGDSVNNGVTDLDALLAGRPQSQGKGCELHRIGDAVSSRNIAAAVYDALRLCHVM